MDSMLIIALVWIIYGFAQLLGAPGFSKKYKEYKEYPWSRDYIRCSGLVWVLMGIIWMAANRILAFFYVSVPVLMIILLIASLPPLLLSAFFEKKYRTKYESELYK